jgi:hypothetical protein
MTHKQVVILTINMVIWTLFLIKSMFEVLQ